jgi:hypothetical protein
MMTDFFLWIRWMEPIDNWLVRERCGFEIYFILLIHAIPTFESPRPHSFFLGLLFGRSLNKCLLSAHLLDIEIGGYIWHYLALFGNSGNKGTVRLAGGQ